MNNLNFLFNRMQARGVPAAQLLAGTGLHLSGTGEITHKASITEYRAVLRRIIELSPPGIGIVMGLETTVADEGVLGYAALSSTTLRDVNALIKTYVSVVEEFTVYSDAVVDDEWRIEFDTVYPMGDVLPFMMEDLFARSKAEFRVYTGIDIPFKSLELSYPEPAYVDRYHEAFRCPLHFGRPRNRLTVDARYLDLPIVFSNPEVCRVLEEQCARVLGSGRNPAHVGTEIRRRLILSPGHYPGLEEMSAAMRISPTTLKRRLRAEGETYQGILDGIRRDLSIQYLSETHLTPKEISYRLGFSNVHNFRRAFKAWTGFNPSHYQA